MTEADILRQAIKEHRAAMFRASSDEDRRTADRELWLSIGAASRLRQEAQYGRVL